MHAQVLFESQGRTKGKAVDLEDMKFHQCVRLARFENDRTISFIPPDGAFDLMCVQELSMHSQFCRNAVASEGHASRLAARVNDTLSHQSAGFDSIEWRWYLRQCRGCHDVTCCQLHSCRTYRLSQNVKPLIWVECVVDKHSRSRTEYLVKARSQFKERSAATNVEISLPLPPDAISPSVRTSQVQMLQMLMMPPSGRRVRRVLFDGGRAECGNGCGQPT
jgi:Adaptor complexes medium subunit family